MGKHGIQWTARNQSEELNFADDLALLSHTHQQMQMKTTSVATVFAPVGFNIYKEKSKILKYNSENTNSITLDGEDQEDMEYLTYLGSIIDKEEG
ncbi:unnamed protein product [Schistosoma curassoni]|uniref:Reverse transcriptase domain-containing protein n=1 Tax=Schistosoma curassoni TaxID=6186 RepID=A0A183KFJ2_9TREM|nr:unnamed protein product [Schistosoma curassoni]